QRPRRASARAGIRPDRADHGGCVREPGGGALLRAMIRVETVLQEGTALYRQQHRVAEGTTIRQLLDGAGFAGVAERITAGSLGLSCHGRRAWLDDRL